MTSEQISNRVREWFIKNTSSIRNHWETRQFLFCPFYLKENLFGEWGQTLKNGQMFTVSYVCRMRMLWKVSIPNLLLLDNKARIEETSDTCPKVCISELCQQNEQKKNSQDFHTVSKHNSIDHHTSLFGKLALFFFLTVWQSITPISQVKNYFCRSSTLGLKHRSVFLLSVHLE